MIRDTLLLSAVLTCSIIFISCSKNETTPIAPGTAYLNLPESPFSYAGTNWPNHVINDNGSLAADNTPVTNPITDHGATLGRVLFYDVNLSKNKSISCASCHQQAFGFSDPNVFSEGFEGGLTGRHSMGLSNARFYQNGRFFWDERATTLEDQVLMPIQDEIEMGMTLDSLVLRVNNLPYYATLFNNAFQSTEVNEERISRALAQFVRSMVSFSSKYDQGRALAQAPGEPFSNFTNEENRGKNIFFNPNLGGCAGCHGTETFVAPAARNNGLETPLVDLGVGGVTERAAQEGLFKVPSLRNIAVRPPYMHDGRFGSLLEVVEHYNSGVQDHPNLSNNLRNADGSVKRLNLSEADKADLVSFLRTLDDQALLNDEKFSDPFNL